MKFSGLRCPNCNTKLLSYGTSFRCVSGHSFDVSAEGYVNLLLANKKNSIAPGDNAEMISARRTLMNAGYYAGVWAQIKEILSKLNNVQTFVDAGCGEGYFSKMASECFNYEILGADISKVAIKYAAKSAKNATFAVASAKELPVFDKSVDLLLCAFAPLFVEEAHRVLNDGGYLLTVTPDVYHLDNVKELLYDRVLLNPETVPIGTPFELIEEKCVESYFKTDGDILYKLVEMTPYFYKTDRSAVQKLSQISEFDVHTAFLIRLYKKNRI